MTALSSLGVPAAIRDTVLATVRMTRGAEQTAMRMAAERELEVIAAAVRAGQQQLRAEASGQRAIVDAALTKLFALPEAESGIPAAQRATVSDLCQRAAYEIVEESRLEIKQGVMDNFGIAQFTLDGVRLRLVSCENDTCGIVRRLSVTFAPADEEPPAATEYTVPGLAAVLCAFGEQERDGKCPLDDAAVAKLLACPALASDSSLRALSPLAVQHVVAVLAQCMAVGDEIRYDCYSIPLFEKLCDEAVL